MREAAVAVVLSCDTYCVCVSARIARVCLRIWCACCVMARVALFVLSWWCVWCGGLRRVCTVCVCAGMLRVCIFRVVSGRAAVYVRVCVCAYMISMLVVLTFLVCMRVVLTFLVSMFFYVFPCGGALDG